MLTTSEAAARLAVSSGHIPWLTAHGHLVGEKKDGRWLVDETSVDAYMAAEAQWITYAHAASLAAVSTDTIRRAVAATELMSRAAGRNRPAIERESLLSWMARRALAQQARNDNDAALQQRLGDDAPPPDGHVWLSRPQAALVLQLSASRVQQLTAEGRVPATKRGRRWWYRRDHVEQIAAARTFCSRTPATSFGCAGHQLVGARRREPVIGDHGLPASTAT